MKRTLTPHTATSLLHRAAARTRRLACRVHGIGLGVLVATALPAHAQDRMAADTLITADTLKADTDVAVQHRPSSLKLGFERLSLPHGERLGLVGTSYLLQLTPNLSLGPAAYGAISGERGGLFTVGVEAAWRQPLTSTLALEAGLYVGGGGGGAAPVGSGLMLRPHLDLTHRWGAYRAGVSVSKVKFPSGDIDSNQVGLVFMADTDFASLPGSSSAPRVPDDAHGVGIDRVVVVSGVYRPEHGSTRLSGAAMSRTIGYVGARLEREFAPGWFGGIEANGAASGGVGGYAEYLGTLGVETRPWDGRLSVGGRVALGMGGGGDVSVGGGLLGKAALIASLRLTPSVSLALEGGLARAPDGRFNASFGALNLVWHLDDAAALRADKTPAGEPREAVKTEWVAGVERYDAARRDGGTRPLEAVVIKANRFVSDSVYLTGQVHSAYGGGAGGYTVGLVGAGVQSGPWNGWRVGGELIAGAGGGGGVDTQGGALLQPTLYVDRAIGTSTSARISVGRIESLKGQLGSTVAELSLVYSFGVATPH